MTATAMDMSGIFAPVVEGLDRLSDLILVCDHASNRFPAPWGDLGLGAEERHAHIAWDIGAEGLMHEMARRLDATTLAATVSRLIYDCNRAPDMAGAMPARSEVFDIPGNAAITTAERVARTTAVYLPFQTALHDLIATRIAAGRRPVVVTVHSFTPIYFGTLRTVEFGVIHDADPRFAKLVLQTAEEMTDLVCGLNAPYSAADDVTHTLRLQATPYGLDHAMLEVRNDLIASPLQQAAMAAVLAPVLDRALSRLKEV